MSPERCSCCGSPSINEMFRDSCVRLDRKGMPSLYGFGVLLDEEMWTWLQAEALKRNMTPHLYARVVLEDVRKLEEQFPDLVAERDTKREETH